MDLMDLMDELNDIDTEYDSVKDFISINKIIKVPHDFFGGPSHHYCKKNNIMFSNSHNGRIKIMNKENVVIDGETIILHPDPRFFTNYRTIENTVIEKQLRELYGGYDGKFYYCDKTKKMFHFHQKPTNPYCFVLEHVHEYSVARLNNVSIPYPPEY